MSDHEERRMDELLIAERGEPDGLYMDAETGQPVWPPLSSDVERKVLELCAIRGIHARRVRPAAAVPVATDGVVYAVGDECRAAAALLAHLTGRRVASVEVGALPSTWGPDIVVTTPERLHPDLLQGMYARDQTWAPGIVVAPGARLVADVLLRAAAARAGGRYATSYVELYPHLEVDPLDGPDGLVMGSATAPTSVASGLQRPAEVMAILTHSDGVDAPLAHQLVLCSLRHHRETGTRPVGALAPYCNESGHCYRFNRPVRDVLASEQVLAFSRMQGRILVFGSCRVLTPAGSSIDFDWSLLENLDASRWGAVVCSYGLIGLEPARFAAVLSDVYRGEPIGRAVARFNQTSTQGRLCVLGDPRVTPSPDAVLPDPVDETFAIEASGGGAAFADDDDDDAHRGFLALWLTLRSHCAETPELKQRALEALDALRSYEETGDDEPLATAIHTVVAPGKLFAQDWSVVPRSVAPLPPRRCPACDALSDVSVHTLVGFDLPRRRVQTCPRCGVVEDAALDNATFLRRDPEGAFALVGEPPERGTRGLLVLRGRGQTVHTAWPSENDQLTSRFMPPRPWPAGLIDVQLFLSRQGRVVVLGLTTRDFIATFPATPLSPYW